MQTSGPRTASVVALTDLVCIAIDRATFSSLLGGISRLLAHPRGASLSAAENHEVLRMAAHLEKYMELLLMSRKDTSGNVAAPPSVKCGMSVGASEGVRGSGGVSATTPSEEEEEEASTFVGEAEEEETDAAWEEAADDCSGEAAAAGFTGLAANAHEAAAMLHLLTAFAPECDAGDVVERVLAAVRRVVWVEDATLFLVDARTDTLLVKISSGHRDLRLSMAGIPGYVARTGRVVRTRLGRRHPRYDAAHDKAAGRHTATTLCVPIVVRSGAEGSDDDSVTSPRVQVAAVLQLHNKLGGWGTDSSPRAPQLVHAETGVRAGAACCCPAYCCCPPPLACTCAHASCPPPQLPLRDQTDQSGVFTPHFTALELQQTMKCAEQLGVLLEQIQMGTVVPGLNSVAGYVPICSLRQPLRMSVRSCTGIACTYTHAAHAPSALHRGAHSRCPCRRRSLRREPRAAAARARAPLPRRPAAGAGG